MAMNPGLAAYIAKKKGGASKVDPNNDGDGMTEAQETPAQRKAEAQNGGKPTADMIRKNKLKQLAGGK
jgi:hypothetical protein